MEKNSKIYVAGHKGLVGSAIVRLLQIKNYNNILTVSSDELDLRDQNEVNNFFSLHRPDYVFLAAAKVGGIRINNNLPADFIFDNLSIQNNIIINSKKYNVKKLLFLGSSCIYPKNSRQPIKEEFLLDGKLEPTNEYYAIAKIAGIKLCQAFNKQFSTNYISVMPTNLYGPNDNYSLNSSHVLPALIRKFHSAKINNFDSVDLWGTGHPRREFLHVDDLADACLFLMEHYNQSDPINIGWGLDISIRELAELIREIIDVKCKICVEDDPTLDGIPAKRLDISRITSLGWSPKITLKEGIISTYKWYIENLTETV